MIFIILTIIKNIKDYLNKSGRLIIVTKEYIFFLFKGIFGAKHYIKYV